MIERTEKRIALGLLRESDQVVAEIERVAEQMQRQGWYFLRSHTDPDLREILLFFERDIEVPDLSESDPKCP